MNKKLFLFFLAAAGVIILSQLTVPKSTTPTPQNTAIISQTEVKNAHLVIEYDNDNFASYNTDVDEKTTAFSLLEKVSQKENILLQTKKYDFGVFVESINGKVSTGEMAWIYFVNGESGQIAADLQKVNPGDTVKWKYVAPSE